MKWFKWGCSHDFQKVSEYLIHFGMAKGITYRCSKCQKEKIEYLRSYRK